MHPGEVIAGRFEIERRVGVPVERKFNLGGTLLTHEALIKGSIDLYPEYTGTALTAVLHQSPASDPAAVRKTVRSAYRNQWHLDWTEPFGFNNTFAMMVRGETARGANLTTLSDAARKQADSRCTLQRLFAVPS